MHPRDGAIIFGDLIGKLDMLRVECPKCGGNADRDWNPRPAQRSPSLSATNFLPHGCSLLALL